MPFYKQPWVWIIAFSVVVAGGVFVLRGEDVFLSRDEVVIAVNEEEMTRREFDIIFKNIQERYLQTMGEEETAKFTEEIKEEAKNAAVEQLLFVSYAKSEGIEISREEVEEFYLEVIEADPGVATKEDILKIWEGEGFREEDADKQVKSALMYEKIYDKYLEEIEITEEEIEEAYRDYLAWVDEVGAPEGEVMEFNEIKEELKEFVSQEKIYRIIEEEIEKFREESDIRIFL